MAFGITPVDQNGIPLGTAIVPGTTTPRALKGGTAYTDANSNILTPVSVQLEDGAKLTYAAAGVGLALAATPTNIATLTGSATKIVKLVRIGLSLKCTALGTTLLDVLLQKFSTALTGGTPVALTMTPTDAGPGIAATALAQNWTANSTGGGALVGNIATTQIMPQFAGALTATDFPQQTLPQILWDFSGSMQQPTLRSAAQVLSINLNGGTLIATTTFSVFMVFTEE